MKKILLTLLIGLTFLSFSPVIKAETYTPQQKQQLIAFIIQEIKILQNQLNLMLSQQSNQTALQNTSKILSPNDICPGSGDVRPIFINYVNNYYPVSANLTWNNSCEITDCKLIFNGQDVLNGDGTVPSSQIQTLNGVLLNNLNHFTEYNYQVSCKNGIYSNSFVTP